jgi:hypothetical protein
MIYFVYLDVVKTNAELRHLDNGKWILSGLVKTGLFGSSEFHYVDFQ